MSANWLLAELATDFATELATDFATELATTLLLNWQRLRCRFGDGFATELATALLLDLVTDCMTRGSCNC